MATFSELKKKYAKIEWYQQGGAGKPLYLSYPWSSCASFTVFHKPIRLHHSGLVGFYNKEFFDFFFRYLSMQKVVDYYYTGTPSYNKFVKQYKYWKRKDVEPLQDYIQNNSQGLSQLSTEALINLLQNFSKIYQMFWRESIFLDAFDAEGHNKLNILLSKLTVQIPLDKLNLLTDPDELSSLQQERVSIIRLARKFSKAGLLKHTANFNWIYNDYAVIESLTEKDFLKEIKAIQKNPNSQTQELQNFKEILKTKQKREQYIKRAKIPREIYVFTDFLRVASKWRDDRKFYNQMANGFIKKIAKEFSVRAKIKLSHIENLWWWELPSVFTRTQIQIIQTSQKRLSGSLYYENPTRNSVLYGNSAIRLMNFLKTSVSAKNTLSGQPAFPGLVTGRIKIIRHQKDFSKLEPGDILLAPNTRPEYVPIMKIAGAILSEEGGITSHSAIVSRELKIPCIVGVQGAIAKFKDGDLVEVDATVGIVRRIEN